MFYIFLSLLIIALDQLSKVLITSSFPLYDEKVIIPRILSFTYVENKGAAFGMLSGARAFFIVFTILVLIGAVYYIIKMKPRSVLEKTALSFIAGGAIGNFIDRLFLGYVRDFIMTTFIDFPVFNVADCFVCIGAGLYILYAFIADKSEGTEK